MSFFDKINKYLIVNSIKEILKAGGLIRLPTANSHVVLGLPAERFQSFSGPYVQCSAAVDNYQSACYSTHIGNSVYKRSIHFLSVMHFLAVSRIWVMRVSRMTMSSVTWQAVASWCIRCSMLNACNNTSIPDNVCRENVVNNSKNVKKSCFWILKKNMLKNLRTVSEAT